MSRSKRLPYSMFKISQIITQDELEDYLNQYEEFVSSKISEIEIKYNEIHELKENSEEDSEYLHFLSNDLIDENMKFGSIFTSNFRSSFLSIVITHLEFELNKICSYHQKRNNIDDGWKDMKGSSDLEKVKNYFKQTENILISSLENWSKINDYKFIRNKFTHQNGEISLSNIKDINKIKLICKKHKGISFEEKHKKIKIVFTSPQLCVESLDTIFKFIEEIISLLDNTTKNHTANTII